MFGLAMTKRRKVSSPVQEGQSDICAELKTFITQENAKFVREIKDSNERRLTALEDSLSFAMDSLAAVSNRQRSADSDILELQRETADLKRRLQQMEISADGQQQAKRLVYLIFSGPAIQAQTRREDAAGLIRSVVQRYMNHSLDSSQVRTMFRLKTGKVLVEFTTADIGSDRDILFKSKSKLKGSGLYIAESLTPRRQGMFSQLLKLRKEGKISSVFTRQGNIFVCRSRDSAPTRIGSPEAVQQLSEAGAARRPVQGRAQEGAEGERPRPVPASGAPDCARDAERGGSSSNLGGGMEVETPSSTGTSARSQRGSGPWRSGGETAASEGLAGDGSPPGCGRPESSLLVCAREAVQMVHLSPPLADAPSGSAAAGRMTDDDELTGACGGSPVPTVTGGGSLPIDRPAVVSPPVAVGLEPPLTGKTAGRRAGTVSALIPTQPSSGHLGSPAGSSSTKGGASSEGSQPGTSVKSPESRRGVGSGEEGAAGIVHGMGEGSTLPGVPQSIPGGSGRARGTSRSRDIREYF